MIIGSLQVEIRIPQAQSLKSKRLVLRSLITKIRTRFNVSISELDGHDLWQSTVLGIVMVANEKRFLDQCLNKVMDHVREVKQIEVLDYQLEFI